MTHKGLNSQQVEQSRAQHGANILTPPPKTPLWRLFLDKFSDPVIRILLMAAFLSLGISMVEGSYYETIGIFCAIFLATGISFWFEVDAAKKFDILNQVNDNTPVKVIRDGQVREVGKTELVVGDIVLLEQGDEVPADARLLESVALQVNESTLTGEPNISKTTDPEDFKTDATYPSNCVYRGTSVTDGHAIAEVTTVGDATEFGKVARQAAEKPVERTPLDRQLERLAKLIGVVGFSLAIVTFLALFIKDLVNPAYHFTLGEVGLLGAALAGVVVALVKVWMPIFYDALELAGKPREMPRAVTRRGWLFWLGMGVLTFAAIASIGYLFGVDPLDPEQWLSLEAAERVLQSFMVSVALIVMAVPEGLPMSVTLSLALSMRKMLKSNNLVRKMHACETMGATTVICTDKTGTLTMNQMSVGAAHFEGFGFPQEQILEAIAVNTTANLNLDDPAKPRPLGNPTEGALLLWMHAGQADYAALRRDSPVVAQLPFSTRHKYMATIVRSASTGRTMLYVKGAPEIVLTKCDVEPTVLAETEKQLAGYQCRAMRTLAFACRELRSEEGLKDLDAEAMMALCTELRMMGFVAIADPVRPDVPAAVAECMAAGIGIKIVTGDTPNTAREIARQIGLWNDAEDGPENEITGVEWEALSDTEARNRAGGLKIMARARPMDKQRLVRLLQHNQEVVAVTGDGTNDAPALNFANVGLSMGSGTSVAKEASDITLLDDSFASIVKAVMWGRSVYRNIQRFVLFQLTINVTAIVVVLLGALLGFELPLTVTQMLWVNLIMDTFAAGALASLPPDPREMKHKPRGLNDFIITPLMGRLIFVTAAAFVALLVTMLFRMKGVDGTVGDYNLSVFFTVFVMLQFWNMFNAKAYATGRSAFANLRQCGAFLAVGMLIIIGQVLIVSFGGKVFRVVPLELIDWLKIIGWTSVVLWVGEIGRFIARLRQPKA